MNHPAPRLDHLALVRVHGADTRTFLDGQLTRDVPTDGAASLAGYCSPKGRLLATFTIWADHDGVWLLMSRDLAEPVLKRLRMYVLRAKAVFEDVTATAAVQGFVDGDWPKAVDALAPWAIHRADGVIWIRMPDADGRRRALRIADEATDGAVDAATWRAAEIRAGLPRIALATQDRFVPQMVNLEALGGVDFRKGCFPGQEVVARSQYLGKLKRRTALATGGDVPAPGADVFASTSADPQGTVVDVERTDDGAVALVELPIALFGDPGLRAGDAPLAIVPLPYELPDNEVFVRPKL